MFWSFFVPELVKWRVGHVLAYPAHQKVQASARLALIVNLGCVKSPWFLFLQTCMFSSAARDVPSMEQQLSGTLGIFHVIVLCLCYPRAVAGAVPVKKRRVWIYQIKKDLICDLCHPLWQSLWSCFPIGNVMIAMVLFGAVGCDIWSPIHSSLTGQGWSLISWEKYQEKYLLLRSIPLWWIQPSHMSGAGSCEFMEPPLSPPLALQSSGLCLPLLNANASYLGVANAKVLL